MSPTFAWIVASIGGAATALRLLWSRVSPSEVKRLPIVRAVLRLMTFHYYEKAEERFLRAHPDGRAEADLVRRKLQQELGLSSQDQFSPPDKPSLHAVDRPAS